MFDVLVIGAGPGGSIAATVLARAGARVCLVDRAAFPRPKLCGDTLNPGACAVLRRPWLYRLAVRCARLVLRPLARDGWLRRLPGAGASWTAARDFPAPAARSFRERWPRL